MTHNSTLTRLQGVLVGHHSLGERPTGCTVVICPDGTVGGVEVRGAAPGTRETDLLAPHNTGWSNMAMVSRWGLFASPSCRLP